MTGVYGNYHYLLVFELCLLFLLALCRFLQLLSRFGPLVLFRERKVLSAMFFTLLLFLYFLSQWLSGGRPAAGIGIAMPASLITRSVIFESSAWFRRLVEPSIWLLAVSLIVAAKDSPRRAAAQCYFAALLSLGAVHGLDIFALAPGGSARERGMTTLVHAGFTQLVLLLTLGGLVLDCAAKSEERPARAASAMRPVLGGVLLVTLAVCWALHRERAAAALNRLQVGVHYYSWFPENWRGGYIGAEMDPPVVPSLGEYSSDDPAVFRQHVEWAKRANVDYFVFDWWPKRPEIGRRIARYLGDESFRLSELKFSLMYESQDLKEPGESAYRGEEQNVTYITPERAWRLKKHWEYLAKTFMRDPSYLRIGGRPVLFVYATRHLVGPVGSAIREARRHVQETTGIDLYLVGDEVFFNVLTYSQRYGLLLRREFVPEWERLSAFDAVTAYNPYDITKPEHGGTAGQAQFVADVERLYRRYKAISAAAGIDFFPGVLPGYNDRGVRLEEDHFVIPRAADDSCRGTLFETALRSLGAAQVDWGQPMLLVTSWNEWNEGTHIEPASPSPFTTRDRSAEGDLYSGGEGLWGYGTCFLDLLAALPRYLD